MLNESDLLLLRLRADELKKRALSGRLRVGSDIDGVICNINQSLIRTLIEEKIDCDFPDDWTLVDSMKPFAPPDFWERCRNHKEFWMGMETIEHPLFSPELYCTSRGFADALEITRQWMMEKKIPLASVYCIGNSKGNRANKVPLLRANNIDVFVEDDPEQWAEINRGGILCVLIDRPWNKNIDAGAFRIGSFSEIEPDSRCSLVLKIIREIKKQTLQAA